mmetsp:Transcript_46814/g.150467  ORF Transcript_46814/g.150467 Transcript_46814/m.150467 type:complete len:212 (-) Transcript_46814:989-1624(-)
MLLHFRFIVFIRAGFKFELLVRYNNVHLRVANPLARRADHRVRARCETRLAALEGAAVMPLHRWSHFFVGIFRRAPILPLRDDAHLLRLGRHGRDHRQRPGLPEQRQRGREGDAGGARRETLEALPAQRHRHALPGGRRALGSRSFLPPLLRTRRRQHDKRRDVVAVRGRPPRPGRLHELPRELLWVRALGQVPRDLRRCFVRLHVLPHPI